VISGIVHMLPARELAGALAQEYGPYTTIYNRFNRSSGGGRTTAIYALTDAVGKPRVLRIATCMT
jgi:hypothetical protein